MRNLSKYILLFLNTVSICCYAQVGINTKSPLHTFHIDGKSDNTVTQLPNAAQEKNDFIITENGQVGIGTLTPKATLDIIGKLKLTNLKSSDLTPEKIVTIDNDGKLHFTDVGNIFPPIETRIFTVVNRESRQRLGKRGQYENVQFDGTISGVNSDKIKVTTNKRELILPPNKTLKITGSLGIIGARLEPTRNYPAFIISGFELRNVQNDGSKILVKTLGYTESSTETLDDGGVSTPLIIVKTGSIGVNVALLVKYNGGDAPSLGYNIAGAPGANTLGSYIFIEEI